MSILDNYYGEGKSIRDKITELEEENRKLKDNVEFLHSCLDDRDKSIEIMKEENKNLKESLDIATKCSSKEEDGIIRLSEENKKLKDENVDLKSELSKFRDIFKKYRDYEKEELAESCYDLARENEKLKDIIGKIVYLYKEEPTELEEYIKSGFKGGMSN